MLYPLILISAFLNIVIGILALSSGKNRLNLSFALICFLLASWNICFYLGNKYELTALYRINFALASFIPPFLLYFVNHLDNRKTFKMARFLFWPMFMCAALNLLFIALTFLSSTAQSMYASKNRNIYIFLYMLISLLLAFVLLLLRYRSAVSTYERKRLLYIIAAFLIVYLAGMLDLFFSIRTGRFFCIGNTVNSLFALIIFYTIHKYRFLNISLVPENIFGCTGFTFDTFYKHPARGIVYRYRLYLQE